MPFTPYHFGPNVLIGLSLRKWIDIPVIILANVIVDTEVLVMNILGIRWPIHRYFHTLLVGAAVGVILGLLLYPMRGMLKKIMNLFRVPYQPKLWKMIISGVLGVWLHVIADAIYHSDVRIFWPIKTRPLWRLLSQSQVKTICLICFALAIIPYAFALLSYLKKTKTQSQGQI